MGNDEFIEKALQAVLKVANSKMAEEPPITVNELYVVWLTKVLQHNKALISTSRNGDGLYFEVTHNGDKQEMYVDHYKKQNNQCIANDKLAAVAPTRAEIEEHIRDWRACKDLIVGLSLEKKQYAADQIAYWTAKLNEMHQAQEIQEDEAQEDR